MHLYQTKITLEFFKKKEHIGLREQEREMGIYPLDPLARNISEFESRVVDELGFQNRVDLQELSSHIAHSVSAGQLLA